MTIQTAGERGRKCKSYRGICLWDSMKNLQRTRGNWVRGVCVCVMVRDMNGCPAMNMQLHWPDCWDSWSVDNREAVFNMRLRCNKTLKRQINLSSFAHWGNDPAVTTQLCWILSSIWLLSSCFLWLTNCCFTSNHATLQAGCLVNTVDF